MVLLEYTNNDAGREVWTMSGIDRERLTGQCLGELIIAEELDPEGQSDEPGRTYVVLDSYFISEFIN